MLYILKKFRLQHQRPSWHGPIASEKETEYLGGSDQQATPPVCMHIIHQWAGPSAG
jgi:hypothetical protein